jgi:hypothetical protein
MHRRVRDRLEDILGTAGGSRLAEGHLDGCAECGDTVTEMRRQQRLLRSLRTPEDIEPRAGFYARVIERIESQGVASIWSLFFESSIGRGVAMASITMALCLGAYLVSSERGVPVEDGQARISSSVPYTGIDTPGMWMGTPDSDAVLVNLVTYRGQ